MISVSRKQTIYFYESYLTWIHTERLIKLTGICDGLPRGRGNKAEKKNNSDHEFDTNMLMYT